MGEPEKPTASTSKPGRNKTRTRINSSRKKRQRNTRNTKGIINTTTRRLLTIPFRGIAGERAHLIDTGAGINLIKENKSDTKIFKSDEPHTFYMGQEKYFTDRFVRIIIFGKPHKFYAVPNDFPLIEDEIIGLPCLEHQYEISNDKIKLGNNIL